MRKCLVILLLCIAWNTCLSIPGKDITIMGPIVLADGLGRLSLGIFDCLKNDVTIQLDPNGCLDRAGVGHKLRPFLRRDATPSTILLVTDPLFRFGHAWSEQHLARGTIKIAYSMMESSRIPQRWVSILNTYFDSVVVPDEAIKDAYRQSGVLKPIFIAPCPSYLHEFLAMPEKKQQNDIFVFGCSAAFQERKNHLLLLQAFAHEFGNNPQVKLLLHGRVAETKPYQDLLNAAQTSQLTNVEIINKKFSQQEYSDFMSSLDCYVFISRGEGFSFTPREALALGVPCILTNNTAHKVLCKTGYVRSVPAYIRIPAYHYYEPSSAFSRRPEGYFFDCTIDDVRRALREVYEQYPLYLERAQEGRNWVKRYLPENVRATYLSLVRPKNVILGSLNRLGEDFLETNDKSLYDKYMNLVIRN